MRDTDWTNRLAFIDGILPVVNAPTVTKVPRPPRNQQALRTDTVQKPIDIILDEITQELVEKESIFMAVRLFQRAREMMEATPNAGEVTLVGEMLTKSIKYFIRANSAKHVIGIQALLADWLWRYGNNKQKSAAVRLAVSGLRKLKDSKIRKATEFNEAEVIQRFVEVAEGKV